MENYEIIEEKGGVPVLAWIKGVPLEDAARTQLVNVARLPFVFDHVAAMPDVHWGIGATIGTVIPTLGAIVPAAVGVDIGCGMIAVRTSLETDRLPDDLSVLRSAIEKAVPHGRTHHGGRNDRGAWGTLPASVERRWKPLEARYEAITAKHPKAYSNNNARHMGTLGTGNHFIEVCIGDDDKVWAMLHSGSRGCGNRIGTYFIGRARKEMERLGVDLPDRDLAYLEEGSTLFDDYVEAVGWAQDYAYQNRTEMMEAVIAAMRGTLPKFRVTGTAVNCHHNYVARETHFGREVWLTRKGAVRARKGDFGIIPGSMGVRSYIVRGLGNPLSFCSCSHGAGRAMSRNEAKRRFTLQDHAQATDGVECRKDSGVIDETPAAYKDIDAVMAAQSDLVEVVHTLKQVVCVKG